MKFSGHEDFGGNFNEIFLNFGPHLIGAVTNDHAHACQIWLRL